MGEGMKGSEFHAPLVSGFMRSSFQVQTTRGRYRTRERKRLHCCSRTGENNTFVAMDLNQKGML